MNITGPNRPVHLPISLAWLRQLPLPHKLGLLERLYGGRLRDKGICWVKTSNGVIWKLDLQDATQRWIVYGDYEGPLQMSWIIRWLADGGVVIDSGANIGQMLLFMAPMPGVIVHAFEPLPDAYDWLTECLNGCPGWRVRLNQFGLSSERQRIVVQVDGARSTARMDWYVEKNLPQAEIAVQPLDDYLQHKEIERVRLWKLDVEGHEPEALRGAKRYLRQQRIDAILVEMSARADVAEVLNEYGYELYRIGPEGQLKKADGGLSGAHNMVALPVERASRIDR